MLCSIYENRCTPSAYCSLVSLMYCSMMSFHVSGAYPCEVSYVSCTYVSARACESLLSINSNFLLTTSSDFSKEHHERSVSLRKMGYMVRVCDKSQIKRVACVSREPEAMRFERGQLLFLS